MNRPISFQVFNFGSDILASQFPYNLERALFTFKDNGQAYIIGSIENSSISRDFL